MKTAALRVDATVIKVNAKEHGGAELGLSCFSLGVDDVGDLASLMKRQVTLTLVEIEPPLPGAGGEPPRRQKKKAPKGKK